MSAPRQPVRLPATMQLVERGWLSSNNLVFDDGESVTVVDTGYASHAPLTVELVDRARRGKPVARIVNTHLHSDHVGGNAALASRFGAEICIPPGQAEAVRNWDESRLMYALTGQRCDRFDYDRLIDPQQPLTLGALQWQSLPGGGHDREMVLLYSDDERLLVSADALWENGFGVIFPELEGLSGFAEQQAALDAIARLAPRTVVPGHGAAFTEVDAALEVAFRRLDSLRRDPERNARHAAKVLLKFWLLEVRSTTRERLHQHFSGVKYLRLIHERYFAHRGFEALLDTFVDELVRAGAAEFADGRLRDRGH